MARVHPRGQWVLALYASTAGAIDMRHGVPHGVPVSQFARYDRTAGGAFDCDDGGTKLDWSRVNDNYCDCSDGTDEPGTPACPLGRYYCVNKGHRGLWLPSSRVGDGVCDCCDGSDEAAEEGAVTNTCVDTCVSEAAIASKQAAQRIEVLESGARAKARYVSLAAKARAELAEKMEDKRRALAAAEEKADVLRENEKALEAEEEGARAAQKSVEDIHILTRFGLEHHSAEQLRSILVDYARRVDPKGKELKRLVDGEPFGGGIGDRCSCGDMADGSGGYQRHEFSGDLGEEDEWVHDDDWHDEYGGYGEHGYEYGADRYGDEYGDAYGDEYGDFGGGSGEWGYEGDGGEDGDEMLRHATEGTETEPGEQAEVDGAGEITTIEGDGTGEASARASSDGLEETETQAVSCPEDFPFLRVTDGSEGWDICYNDESFAIAGTGPCDSWCAPGPSWLKVKDLWGECGQLCRAAADVHDGLSEMNDATHGKADPEKVGEGEVHEEQDLLAPPGSAPATSTPLKKLRVEIRSAEKHERQVARELEELEEEAGADMGPDDEYQPLWGKCWSLVHAQYTYEVCVGGEARQKDGKGPGVGLGEWTGFEDDGEADPSQGLPGRAFVFKHGDHCWNGPSRSLRVSLFCAAEEKLSEVDEPSTCEYVMKFGTPAACDLAHQQGLSYDDLDDGDDDALPGTED